MVVEMVKMVIRIRQMCGRARVGSASVFLGRARTREYRHCRDPVFDLHYLVSPGCNSQMQLPKSDRSETTKKTIYLLFIIVLL